MAGQQSDEDFEEIESALRRAAKEHRIELPDSEEQSSAHVPLESQYLSDEEVEEKTSEIEAKLAKATAGSSLRKLDSDDSDDLSDVEGTEIDSHLDRIEQVSISARQRSSTRLSEDRQEQRMQQSAALGLGVGMSIAYAFIGLPIVGYFGGMLLGNTMNSPDMKTYGAILGIVLGFAMMILLLAKHSKRL